MNKDELLCDYYDRWVSIYKEGAIQPVTMKKFKLTMMWLRKLAPEITLAELDRNTYQKILNDYAETHERQTVMDFHHQLKGAIIDAVDERLIERDPTRKTIIKGKKAAEKKQSI